MWDDISTLLRSKRSW